ncbi:hypothetical protein L3Q82_009133 [Scortum barcoo]|uniref:Uncharacterized protein n=1 Tax=Scortum barcoo TaxID=214431 RepID=A0ACB8XB88_9TELE|nr:hypothetical protein L3Q82_009133 [Scortum barcoo]
MDSLPFNSVLLEISDQLSADQLEQLKFLCQDLIGKREREKISRGQRLFELLMQRGRLGPDNTDYLSQLLTKVHRRDLSDKLNTFQSESGNTEDQPDQTEKDKLDIATEVIAENLGKSWRKLGRKLGLSEVKLESISKRHPTDLEETTIELLKEWRRSRGAEAQTEELISALRACQFNLTADKLEDRLLIKGD